MELKRYDDFSSLKPIEDRIDEIINLFPDIDSLIDLFESIDGFKLKNIKPSLYKSSGLFRKSWCGGLLIDDVKYFNLSRTGERSQLEELFLQELVYPKKDYDAKAIETFVKKWRGFSLKLFEIKNDKIKSTKNLAPCYKVNLEITNSRINEFNFNIDVEFEKEVTELKTYLASKELKFILLDKIKDSKFNIIVIDNKYATGY
jgi:hypothetical protein